MKICDIMIIDSGKGIKCARKKEFNMDLERQQIDVFLEKCDDVMRSKFIIADTKISELLKSIATSDLLYAFFREITKDFDYAAAQRKYMNYAPEGKMCIRDSPGRKKNCATSRSLFPPSFIWNRRIPTA